MTAPDLESLKGQNLAELSRALQELAPRVLAAYDTYKALIQQQRLLLTARTLREHGLCIGSRFRLLGEYYGRQNPVCEVRGVFAGAIEFSLLKKDGTHRTQILCLTPGDEIELLPSNS